MKFSPRTAVACLVVLLALAGVFCLAATGILQPWRTFRSSIYPISLHLPQGLRGTGDSGAGAPLDTIELSRGQSGVQITISPAPDGGSVLTKDAAARSYPLVESLDTEPFTVAPGVVGFAFERGDAAGALTDVWFEYKGYLYQFDSFNGGEVELLPIVRSLTLL